MAIPSKGKVSPSACLTWEVFAIRRTGSNAPASAGGPDLRRAWPCAEDVQEEEEPHEEEVSKAEANAPQQRADPFPFATSSILKSVGPRVEADSPSVPLSARQVPQLEHAAYSIPSRPNRQLTKRDLGTYDYRSLNAELQLGSLNAQL